MCRVRLKLLKNLASIEKNIVFSVNLEFWCNLAGVKKIFCLKLELANLKSTTVCKKIRYTLEPVYSAR